MDPPNEGTKQPPRQYTIKRVLAWMALLGIWLAGLATPLMFEAALILTALLLLWSSISKRHWMRLAALLIVPAVVHFLDAPSVEADPLLKTPEVRGETMWCNFIVGLIVALFCCLYLSLLARERFLAVSILAVLLCGAVGALARYSAEYYYRNTIDYRLRLPNGAAMRLQGGRIAAELYMNWKYSRPKTKLNHFRFEMGEFAKASFELTGTFVGYVRSSRDGGDYFLGPRFVLHLNYLTTAVICGLLAVPWRQIYGWLARMAQT